MNKIRDKIVSDNYTDSVLCIDKPEGITSFGVVKTVRRLMKIRKVGHAGTLDPIATGLLIVCTGKATKRTGEFMNLTKEYEAVGILGKCTDSYDISGEVIREEVVPLIPEEELTGHCLKFKGVIQQVPPMYSAIKKNGVPLYKLARKGQEVEREAREINIYDIDVLWVELPRFAIRVVCSKGTYIRSLIHDIGDSIGCGACMEALRRTKIGDYSVHNAFSLKDLESHVEV